MNEADFVEDARLVERVGPRKPSILPPAGSRSSRREASHAIARRDPDRSMLGQVIGQQKLCIE